MYFKGDISLSSQELKRCLQAYGCSLPASRLEYSGAITWQLFRLMLHRLWIGRFISRRAGGLFVDGYIILEILKYIFSYISINLIVDKPVLWRYHL